MIRQFDDVAEFARLTGPLLRADPARNTVLLTATNGLLIAPDPEAAAAFVAVVDGGVPVAAALQLRNYPVTVMIDPAAGPRERIATELSRAVADHVPRVTWFAGPRGDCQQVAGGWAALAGGALRPFMTMLLHRLGEFRPAIGVLGTSRRADQHHPSDLELLARWRHDFSLAIGDPVPDEADERSVLRSLRAGATVMLWSDENGDPVAYAAHSPVIEGMARIGPVYTPAGRERRGYGSAVTSAAVRSALELGATEVVLFTDVANPTSNGIYRRLGFEPVEEFVELVVV